MNHRQKWRGPETRARHHRSFQAIGVSPSRRQDLRLAAAVWNRNDAAGRLVKPSGADLV